MFPRGSGSQQPFSSPRNQSNLPVSGSQSHAGHSSPLVQSVETPDFSPSVLPGSDSHWPIQHIQSSISAIQGGLQSTRGSALSLPAHHSTTNTRTSQPHTLPGSNYPLTESTAHSSIEDTTPIKEEIGSEDPRYVKLNRRKTRPGSVLTRASPPQRPWHLIIPHVSSIRHLFCWPNAAQYSSYEVYPDMVLGGVY